MVDVNTFYSYELLVIENLLNDKMIFEPISINDIYNYLSFFNYKTSSKHSIFLESLLSSYKIDSDEYKEIVNRLNAEYEKNTNIDIFSSLKTEIKMMKYINDNLKNEILEMKKFHFSTFTSIETKMSKDEDKLECITEEDFNFFSN